MTRNEQRQQKRKVAKLRAEFYDQPWAIMPRALGAIGHAIETADLESVQELLSRGRDGFDPDSRIPMDDDEPNDSSMRIVNGVAIIPVTGVLRDSPDYMVRWGGASAYQLIEKDFAKALADDQVKGILLYSDSPGGSAIGCKRAADMIFASRGRKPVHAYVQGVCCSAAYYLATATDKISATADSLVGCVGTIFTHAEFSAALKEMGIGATVITNSDSPRKGHGNPYEPLSDDAKQTLQKYINSYGRSFIEDVARYRGIEASEVIEKFGQGDSTRADHAIRSGMIDAIAGGIAEAIAGVLGATGSQQSSPVENLLQSIPASTSQVVSGVVDSSPVETGSFFSEETDMKVSKKIRAQLYASDMIESPDATDEVCTASLKAWFRGSVPEDESAVLSGLRSSSVVQVAAEGTDPDNEEDEPEEDEPDEEEDGEGKDKTTSKLNRRQAKNVQKARETEFGEARLADLKASADLVNQAVGSTVVTGDMVLSAFEAKMGPQDAMKHWNKTLAEREPAVPGMRVNVTGEGRDRFASDAIDALLYRSLDNSSADLSDGAAEMVSHPLWAIAGKCLEVSGRKVDMYGSRELLAEEAMQMGEATRRTTFFSSAEKRQYVQASSSPFSRPGDFPNILSGLANKFLDMIELDEDFSFPEISAVLPGGLNDFKPALMINKGVVEEMDELQDADQLNDLGLEEEVLSYIFLRRFGNRWGWTPVMVANDDMGAFVEGMIGLREAWEVTQNRLVLDRFTANDDLLDGDPLFANRADTGTGAIPAANNNTRTAGLAPSDAEWGEMSALYAGIGGVGTGRRVRGTLNTILVPTNKVHQEAVRTFETYPVIGEGKQADTTANIGLYRNKVRVVPESELNSVNATAYYGLRSPTRLNTATVVRAYFNGFGTAGRRERWYDPSNKTTYVSLEGRIAVAVKNWRYAIRNAGTGG